MCRARARPASKPFYWLLQGALPTLHGMFSRSVFLAALVMLASLWVLSMLGAHSAGAKQAQLECQTTADELAAKVRAELDRARDAETQARQETTREAIRIAETRARDAAAAERSRGSLQQRASAVAAAACAPVVAASAAEPARPPAEPAAVVLAELLSWADERAAAAAAALDAAHAAGTACEREHDAAVSAARP